MRRITLEKLIEWALMAALAVGGSIVAGATLKGAQAEKVSSHESRILSLEAWQKETIAVQAHTSDKVDALDDKMDALLKNLEVSYTPKRRTR